MTFSLKGLGRLRALAIVTLIALCAPVAAFAQQPEPAAAAQGQEEESLVTPRKSRQGALHPTVDAPAPAGRAWVVAGVAVVALQPGGAAGGHEGQGQEE